MPALTAPDTSVPSVTAADIRSVFLGLNPRKVMGLDGVPGRALGSCTDQLAEVFTNIFNPFHLQAKVGTCFKKTTISQSTADAISPALHSSLQHLDNKDTYVRFLLIDYAIIPSRLISKLHDIGLGSAVYNWIFTFLTNRPQSVRIVGQISNNNKSIYGREIEGLVTWCNENNLSLKVGKTKELIIDFRKKGGEQAPIYINDVEVERVESIKFLRVSITDNLSWTSHVDVTVKKAQQLLFFLMWLRKFGMSIRTLTNFYRCIESI
eukprot:g36656.t1